VEVKVKKYLFLLVLVIFPNVCFALSEAYKFSILENLDIALSKNSKYVWGAIGTEKDGIFQVDCSGLGFYITSSVRRAGIPVKRTTSERMSHGMDGWDSVEVDINDADEADIIFFTFSKDRPRGHVGYMKTHKKSNLLMVIHASSSKKKIAQEGVKGELLDHFTVMRRPTWGDKKIKPSLG
jgi:hypothetical protein